MPGSRCASIVLPEPGEPTKSRLWPPAAAISSARRGTSCPRTSPRSGRGAGARGGGLGTAPLDDTASASPRSRATSSPRCRGAWTSHPPTTAASPAFSGGTISRRTSWRARPGGDRQDAAHRAQRSVERQLADEQRARQRRRVDHARRAEHPDGDRDVVSGAVLAQVGGRQVDGDPARRQLEAAVLQRAADADAPLAHARRRPARRCCSRGARPPRRPRRRSGRLRSPPRRRRRHARTCRQTLRARCQRAARAARRSSAGQRRPGPAAATAASVGRSAPGFGPAGGAV